MMKAIADYRMKDVIYNHTSKQSPSDSKFHFHTHDICELIFLKKGNVKAVIDGKEYKLYENSLVIFKPNVVHRIKIEDNSTYERIAVLFDEKIIGSVAYNRIDKSLHVINLNGNNYVLDIFKKFEYYFSVLSSDDFYIILKNLIEEILYNLAIIKSKDFDNSYNIINPVINGAIEYIENNYKSNITVDNICKELFISKCHLHHLFISILKTSPKKYINIKRLNEARILIRAGRKPHDVYSLCGFTDYGTFYRNYKNYFGHIPSKENEFEIERKIKS